MSKPVAVACFAKHSSSALRHLVMELYYERRREGLEQPNLSTRETCLEWFVNHYVWSAFHKCWFERSMKGRASINEMSREQWKTTKRFYERAANL